MPKVRVLPDILASQVAAGEVVERPASVVKELVENSIDAGAREIRVEIDKGGAALIRVTDDGCGMSREDALLSLERHATSKLRHAEDLAAILTLGFRGEAVPSIASVSRFRMVTRETNAVSGTEIQVDGGVLRDVKDAGCAPGTMIEARALFFNMPARRKFLRAESTEMAHIEHQLRLHALAAPQVRLRLRKDGREGFDLPAVSRPIDRVRQFLEPEIAGELIPLATAREHGISIEGFVLPARHARKGRRHQCVFLNGRPIEDPAISRGLAEGFRGTLVEGLHPAAWLWIEMDPRLVDVNVHPAKREVRFHRPLELKDAIVAALATATTPRLAPFPAPSSSLVPSAQDITQAFRPLQTELPDSGESPSDKSFAFPAAPASPSSSSQVSLFRPVGVLLNQYILMESGEGLVLLDPKAAHQRILYERILATRPHGPECQPLLVPILMDFDPRDRDLLLRERLALNEAGIEINDFGGNTVQIGALPSCLESADPRTLISGLLDDLLHGSVVGPRFAFERLARLLAARASSSITPRLAETPQLLERLFHCDLPYCTADGSPTLVEFSLKEIGRRFAPGS